MSNDNRKTMSLLIDNRPVILSGAKNLTADEKPFDELRVTLGQP